MQVVVGCVRDRVPGSMASVISQLVVLVQLSAAAAAADAQAVTFDADALNAATGSRQTRRYPDTLVCFFDR